MIQANEYRLGNYVYVIDQIKEVSIYHLKNMEVGNIFYKPIPLTEDILLKCGFAGFAMLINDGDKFEVSPILGCAWYEALLISNRVTYLHQLQNLYFALTGEELICNLK